MCNYHFLKFNSLQMKEIPGIFKLTPAILFFLFSCNTGGGTSKIMTAADSAANAKRIADSTLLVQDSIFKLKQIDTLKALGLATLDDSVCSGIGRLLFSTNGLIIDPIDFTTSMAQMIECNNREWNKAHPEEPRITFATPTTENDNPKILFNTISLKTGEDIANASKKIITLVLAAETGNEMATAIGTVAGNYSVNAYLESAKKNDPLIFIMPNAIPNVQLGKDALKIGKEAFKVASKLPIDKPFTLQFDAGKKVVETAILGVKAAEKFVVKNGKAVLKDGIPIPGVPKIFDPTNPSSPIGPLGPLGPVLGPIIKKFW